MQRQVKLTFIQSKLRHELKANVFNFGRKLKANYAVVVYTTYLFLFISVYTTIIENNTF